MLKKQEGKPHRGLVEPHKSTSWTIFFLGSILGRVLLGVGIQIGDNLVNRYVFPRDHHFQLSII
jgi:hypothetical protein